MANRWHLAPKSGNRKTGKIAVTTSAEATCPSSCPLKRGDCACYAKSGRLSWHWEAVSKGKRGTTFAKHLAALRALPAGSLVRLHQAGDLPGDGKWVDIKRALLLCHAAASGGKLAWTYTHYEDPSALRALNEDTGTTVNASAPTLREAAMLAASGIPATVIASSVPKGKRFGISFVRCPADNGKTESCATCGAGRPLCARKERSYVVVFKPKGRLRHG